jgi:hypothetical protein
MAHPTGVGSGFAVPRLPRFRVPRTASPLESGTRVAPSIKVALDIGLPPASSALGLSQTFDGLLLQTARLSCFIQTPPMGFKEHEQPMSACGPDRATLGDCPSGNTSRARKHGKPSLQGSVAKQAPMSKHPLAKSSSQTKRRRVTHHSNRKQLEREEGTSTGLPFGPHGQTAQPASVAEVSLTTRTASSSNGRRTLRQTRKRKPTTGIGHRCQTQRLRCPNNI